MSAMTSAGVPEYAVVAGDVHRDRDAIVSVCSANLSTGARYAAKYDWFYLDCPRGEPVVELLRHGPSGECVGVAAIGPRRMLLDGKEIRAGVLVDLVVDGRHRSLGPALMLQRAVLERASAEFDLVYGFPNPKALPVVRRVGYSSLCDIVRSSRVLHYAPYLERLLPRLAARALGAVFDRFDRCRDLWRRLRGSRLAGEWREHVDVRMQDLWDSTRPSAGLVSIRDAEALGWRFDRAEFTRARYLLVGARLGGPISAWFACQADGATLHVRDFWSAGTTAGIARAALDALIRAARDGGYAVVSTECADERGMLDAWRAAGFVERGRRPVVGAWRAPLADALRDIAIHLTPADEDE